MKANTKIQKEVETLLGEVSDFKFSEKQVKANFPHIGIANGKRVFCTECETAYKEVRTTGRVRCKNCNKILRLVTNYSKRTCCIEDYIIVTEVVGRFQVNRFFYLRESYARKFGWLYCWEEVMQKWVCDNGKLVTRAKSFLPMCAEPIWQLLSEMSFRKNKNYTSYCYDRYDIDSDNVIVKSILPVLKDRGYNGKDIFNGRSQVSLQLDLLRESKLETLIKCGFDEFANLRDGEILGFWKQIKVCMRHNYHLDTNGVGLWLDMLRTLDYLGKDTHNPKFICPENIKESHDYWMKVRTDKIEKEEAQRKAERERKIALAEAKKNSYPQRMAAFLGIFINGGDFTIRPLQSVAEFQEEGEAMHHCVFSCEYYNKDNCLILSVRDKDNNRISTVEYDLSNYQIVQNRAACNAVPQLYDEINKCIEDNKILFVKAVANSVKSAVIAA